MEYYFIMYVWQYRKSSDSSWFHSEAVTNKHPLHWLKDARDNDKEETYEYHIIGWKEITRSEYDMVVDIFN